METTGNWYYQEHGQTNAPLVSEELLKLFDSGQITSETPVRQARKEWQTASIASVVGDFHTANVIGSTIDISA